MTTLLRDLRLGIRMLGKHRGTTIIAVIALGLGIGLTTTMFSVIKGHALAGLPYDNPGQLVALRTTNPEDPEDTNGVTVHDFLDWRQAASFEGMSAWSRATFNLSDDEGPERYPGAFVHAEVFDLLRVPPLMGRTLQAADGFPGAPLVVLINERVWRGQFGGDPEIVGKTVRANGTMATVVGVMPEWLEFPIEDVVWVPLVLDEGAVRGDRARFIPSLLSSEGSLGSTLLARVRDGVELDQAFAELSGIARRLELEYPEANQGIQPSMQPFIRQFIGERFIQMNFLMMAAVFGVLLIACANVANILLVRAAGRSKEIAVRTTLGAGRGEVIRQMLTETFIFTAIGGALGVGLSYVGVALYRAGVEPSGPIFWLDVTIDGPALAFVLVVTFLATLISGTVPALRASGTDLNEVLKDESRGSSSLRVGKLSRSLVVFEIALSCGLLVAAGLMVRTLVKLRTLDFGFATEDVLTARTGLMEADYPDEASRVRFYQELQERLEARPGVAGAAIAGRLQVRGMTGPRPFGMEGASYTDVRDYPRARRMPVSPNYFQALDVDVLQGREFMWSDDVDAVGVAVVNESFAERFFQGENVIGRQIRDANPNVDESLWPWLTIVGVVPDLSSGGFFNENPEGFYTPLSQGTQNFFNILVRTRDEPLDFVPMLRAEVFAIDPHLPIYWVWSMAQDRRNNTTYWVIWGTLYAVFGFVALFLAAIGLYGVMAFSVRMRTREIGLRVALGATTESVLKLVLKQGMTQLVLGVTIGLGIAVVLSRVIASLLLAVEPWDPALFMGIVLTLALVGLLACLIPAQRAARVDPMSAMRYD